MSSESTFPAHSLRSSYVAARHGLGGANDASSAGGGAASASWDSSGFGVTGAAGTHHSPVQFRAGWTLVIMAPARRLGRLHGGRQERTGDIIGERCNAASTNMHRNIRAAFVGSK